MTVGEFIFQNPSPQVRFDSLSTQHSQIHNDQTREGCGEPTAVSLRNRPFIVPLSFLTQSLFFCHNMLCLTCLSIFVCATASMLLAWLLSVCVSAPYGICISCRIISSSKFQSYSWAHWRCCGACQMQPAL